jgi:sigma-B regulation protein RsbU (phosphoserine phosphatase)
VRPDKLKLELQLNSITLAALARSCHVQTPSGDNSHQPNHFRKTMQAEPLKVLIIENDAAFSRAVKGMLDQTLDTPVTVAAATSLNEGLAKLQASPFDVVILEFFLADGAGLANVPLLKDKALRVPIIVVGSADDESIAVEAVQAGAEDYVVKSQLNPQWLLRSIRYAIERHRSDMALLDAEENYRNIFNHLVEGIFQTTPDGHYLMANAALARIYGYGTPEELMGSVTDIGRKLYVQPGRRDEFRRIMDELDTITGFESQIYRKDGSVIWISENCKAVRDAGGKLVYYEGTVEDITARRDAEERVRASEAIYHSLVETMPQGVFRRDLQGRFTFANQHYCKYHGVKPEDILGKSDFDLYPKEAAEKYWRDDRHIMETNETMTIIEETQPVGAKQKCYHHVIKSPLYGLDGKIAGLQGMFWDITKERQLEEQIRHSEALYHSLVETMPQNIFRKDLQGRYTFVNPQFCKTLGKSYDQVLGRTIADFLPAEQAALREQNDRLVMETKKPFETSEESKFPGGGLTYIQVIKMPIFDADGKVIGLQGMFWDITQQKMAAEKIRQANAELALSQAELRLKNAQMEDDLKMAAEIQVTMLPQQYPTVPHSATPAESAFQFTHRYLPSGAVGGDFFSVSALSDSEVGVFICDVAGHGVRSALITAMIRALVEELKFLAGDPGEFLTKLNSDLWAILKHTGTPVLTTAFYLAANAKTGAMRYASAGHPKPLHLRRAAGKVEPLKNTTKQNQPALGLFENARYLTSTATLVPRDLVMLFTDGLYEVESAGQNLYNQELLVAAVHKRLPLPPAQMFDELLNEIRAYAAEHTFNDDVCLVGMEFAGLKSA